MEAPPVASLSGVDVWLGGRHVLHEVSFSLGQAEVTGLIGANGAGKTTVLRSMLGLQAVARGQVLVEGRPPGRRRQPIGYVPQKVVVDPDVPLRARDLVALGIDGERYGIRLPSRRRREAVEGMLDAVGATAFAGQRVGVLSGGELQRVLLAHALINRPRLLLLDEPLANLDLKGTQDTVELLGRIAADHGLAVLLSAHDINPLLAVMDRVVYLAAGRAASGPTGEVVTSEVLTRLYQHPVRVLRVDGRVLVAAGPAPSPGAGLEELAGPAQVVAGR